MRVTHTKYGEARLFVQHARGLLRQCLHRQATILRRLSLTSRGRDKYNILLTRKLIDRIVIHREHARTKTAQLRTHRKTLRDLFCATAIRCEQNEERWALHRAQHLVVGLFRFLLLLLT